MRRRKVSNRTMPELLRSPINTAPLAALSMSETLKQTFIVDNKAGANGVIGAAQVASAPPDGYTLLVASIGPNAIAPSMMAKVPYGVSSFSVQ